MTELKLLALLCERILLLTQALALAPVVLDGARSSRVAVVQTAAAVSVLVSVSLVEQRLRE